MRGFKKAIKYVAAIATAGAMVGAGILAGLAVDLSNFQTKFYDNQNKFDGIVVVGENAKPIDIVGAIEVGAAFAQKAVSPVSAAGTAYTGAKIFNEPLDTPFGNKTVKLGDWILPGLADNEEISIGQNTAHYSEYVIVNQSAYELHTYNPTTSSVYHAINDTPVFYATGNATEYEIKLSSDFNTSWVSNQTPLELNILGDKYKIIGFPSNTSMKVMYAQEYMMSTNQSVTVDGKQVSLVMISTNSAVFNVGGTQVIINEGDKKLVNGLWVQLNDIFYNPNTNQNLVNVYIGTKLTDTINSGEKFEDKDGFYWDINMTKGVIGVKADGFNLTAGNTYAFPNNLIKIKYDSVYPTDYAKFTISSTTNGITIKAPTGKYYLEAINGTKEYDTDSMTLKFVGMNGNDTIINVNPGNGNDFNVTVHDNTSTADNIGDLVYGNMDYAIKLNDTTVGFANDLHLLIGNKIDIDLGANMTNMNDVRYGTYNLVNTTKTVMMQDGEKFEDVKDNLNKDTPEVIIDVPSDKVQGKVVIMGPQSTYSTGTAGVAVNPIDVSSFAALDSQVGTTPTKPVILVGGPAVNSLVKELADNNMTTTLSEWRSGDMTNKAVIQYIDDAFGGNQPALVIAGYSGQDTLIACKVVADHILHPEDFKSDFTGNKTTIDTTSANYASLKFSS